jgi:hypothetical protein
MISETQDVASLKRTENDGEIFVVAYDQAKESADKAALMHKSYFGKDKDKQIFSILEEPLKKIELIPVDLSILTRY